MPKRKVQFVQGGFYHIYNRGAARQSIFLNKDNYIYLLRLLKTVAAECEVTVIAYCLLPNHYHWMVRQDGETPAGRVPSRVFGSYSQAFNKVHSRSGRLFERPYEAIAVRTDPYLRHLPCYIHANPVRHNIAASLGQWPYSNYLEWMCQRAGTLVDHKFVTDHFDTRGRYDAFLQSYLAGEIVLRKGLREHFERLP